MRTATQISCWLAVVAVLGVIGLVQEVIVHAWLTMLVGIGAGMACYLIGRRRGALAARRLLADAMRPPDPAEDLAILRDVNDQLRAQLASARAAAYAAWDPSFAVARPDPGQHEGDPRSGARSLGRQP